MLNQVRAQPDEIEAIEDAIAVWWPHPLLESDLQKLKQFSAQGSLGVVDDLTIQQLALPHPIFDRNKQEAASRNATQLTLDEEARQQVQALQALQALQAQALPSASLAGCRNVGLVNAGKNLCATNSLLQVSRSARNCG
eukprot:SAG31_NODE_1659_length_7602_cov_7.696122_4_plen_139_part_00